MRTRLRRYLTQNAHHILLLLLTLFVLSAVVLGEWIGMYNKVWWWDDMLHGLSGILLGFVGLLAIYLFNAHYNMTINPLFVAVFVFCFAIALGVAWEIFEFNMDVIFGTATQQWNMPPNAIVIGRKFQGMGLRDTMSDLIAATIGSFVAAVLSYTMYKRQKRTVLSVMRRAFGKYIRK